MTPRDPVSTPSIEWTYPLVEGVGCRWARTHSECRSLRTTRIIFRSRTVHIQSSGRFGLRIQPVDATLVQEVEGGVYVEESKEPSTFQDGKDAESPEASEIAGRGLDELSQLVIHGLASHGG